LENIKKIVPRICIYVVILTKSFSLMKVKAERWNQSCYNCSSNPNFNPRERAIIAVWTVSICNKKL